MCVTNTVWRRPVAKLPPSAVGLKAASGFGPHQVPSTAAAAASVRKQQDEARQLLLRRKLATGDQDGGSSLRTAEAFLERRKEGGEGINGGRTQAKGAAVAEQAGSASSVPSSGGQRQPNEPCSLSRAAHPHGVVTHSYHDHSGDTDGHTKVCTRGGVTCPFPLKLHEMLDQIEQDGLANVISWQPHGRAFVVHNARTFVDIVMPKYFKQTKMASFQRQLNLYGFQRITAGLDRGAYYHELFLRGMPFLSNGMQRTRVKGTGVRMASSPETEPNFYAMSPVNPSHCPGRRTTGSVEWAGDIAASPTLSRETLRGLTAHPLAKVHPIHGLTSSAATVAKAVSKPPPIVTPCSALQRPKQTLKGSRTEMAGSTAPVPPPPLAPVPPQPLPSGLCVSGVTHPPLPPPPALESFIHRPIVGRGGGSGPSAPFVLAGTADPTAVLESSRSFEGNMLQYLASLHAEKAALEALTAPAVTAAEAADAMEPIPFRFEGDKNRSGTTTAAAAPFSKEEPPPGLRCLPRDFIPPLASTSASPSSSKAEEEEAAEEEGPREQQQVPPHLLSPKAKDDEMNRFLEELFESDKTMDPFEMDDDMALDDEALGYLLEEAVDE